MFKGEKRWAQLKRSAEMKLRKIMGNPPKNPAIPDPSGRCRLLELPRELRDQIYSYLSDEDVVLYDNEIFEARRNHSEPFTYELAADQTVSCSEILDPVLLHVNHQIRAEYDEEMVKALAKQRLTINVYNLDATVYDAKKLKRWQPMMTKFLDRDALTLKISRRFGKTDIQTIVSRTKKFAIEIDAYYLHEGRTWDFHGNISRYWQAPTMIFSRVKDFAEELEIRLRVRAGSQRKHSSVRAFVSSRINDNIWKEGKLRKLTVTVFEKDWFPSGNGPLENLNKDSVIFKEEMRWHHEGDGDEAGTEAEGKHNEDKKV